MANRNPKNKWVKGCPSPNPGGRPATNREVREKAKTMTMDVLTVFHGMLMDPKMHPMARIAAGKEINDRAEGKAPQTSLNVNADLDGGGGDGSGVNALLQRARLEQLNKQNKAKTIEHKPNGQWREPAPKPEPVEPEPVVDTRPEPKPDPKPVILTRIPDPAPPPPPRPEPPMAAPPVDPPKYERVPGTNRVRRAK